MKHIKTIDMLLERADRRGYAQLVRNGRTVYEVIKEGEIYTLKHYGTVTIKYDGINEVLLEWYGEGVSDRDSMNTFLSCLGEDRYYFRYGSVMGFVMENEEGERYETNT
jgi:hypothetical protein